MTKQTVPTRIAAAVGLRLIFAGWPIFSFYSTSKKDARFAQDNLRQRLEAPDHSMNSGPLDHELS